MLAPLLTLKGDLRITIADCYGMGTVVWFRIEDASGLLDEVCIDCRSESPTYRRLFDRARHPSKPSAVLIDLGTEEEGIVVALVSHWLDSDGPRLQGMSDFGWELFRDAILLIGDAT